MSLLIESPLIETAWLQEHLGDPNLRIIDCSVAGQPNKDGTYVFFPQFEEWKTGHIPSSVFVDIPEQLSDKDSAIGLMMPPPEVFASILKNLGIGDGNAVVLYDRTNNAWAARVWWMLRVCGFDNAAVLNGGWNKWKGEGLDIEEGVVEYPPAKTFTLHPRPELMADKNRVLNSIGASDVTLLHSLPLPMFTGEVSPYARPGRITGSKNLSCESIVDPESHCYLDLETIRTMAEDTGVLGSEQVITYCGGGIAASSTALALTLLGVKNLAVYDGSLSEWATDPDLPMETG